METGKKIIIDFTEKIETDLSGKGDLESISMIGLVSVKNPSSSHRIWNSSVLLEGINSVSLTENEIKTGEINAGDTKTFEYKLNTTEVVQKPLIELSETIDTYYEKGEEVNWNYVLNHRMPTNFSIKLSNNATSQAKVNLIKNIPDYFDTPHIDTPSAGVTEYKESAHEVHWTEITIPAGDSVILNIRLGATPDNTDLHESGKIEVEYEIQNVIRSSLNGKILGLSDNLFAIDNEEVSQNNWACSVEFQNLSDFQVVLNNAKVSQIKEATKEIVLEENPEIKLNPQVSWTKDFNVASVGIPKFSKTNTFSVLYEVKKKIIGKIIKKTDDIPVAAIKCEKILEPDTVNAHAKTNMQVKSRTKNMGTAALFEIKVEDTIPASFKPPSLDLIRTLVRGTELRQGVILEMSPNDEDPAVQHMLTVSIPNLSNITNPLNPGDELSVEYPIIGWDPSPGDYPCPLTSELNVIPQGPSVKAGVPEIKITAKTVRRKYRAYKSVTPGAEEGQYVIPIVFANKGEVPVEKVTIKDLIPSNFTFISSQPEELKPETTDVEGGIKITWKLSDITPGQQIEVKYTIKGTGEYESQDPEISFE
ncbi:MAG: hypothetical protein ACFFCM_04355 [Promethearchaeota archaeon]